MSDFHAITVSCQIFESGKYSTISDNYKNKKPARKYLDTVRKRSKASLNSNGKIDRSELCYFLLKFPSIT
jgi:hypothetical protein